MKKHISKLFLLFVSCFVFVMAGCGENANVKGQWTLSGFSGQYNGFVFEYTSSQADEFVFDSSLDINTATPEQVVKNLIAIKKGNVSGLVLTFGNDNVFSYSVGDTTFDGTFEVKGDKVTTITEGQHEIVYIVIDEKTMYSQTLIDDNSYINDIYKKI